MPFCPECHVEFRDGFTTCSDCGAALIPNEPDSSQLGPIRKKSRSQCPDEERHHAGGRFLANVNDAVELAYILSALSWRGIPFRVLGEDSSQYLAILHGRSFMGVNIYVPADSLAEAFEVLASYRAPLLPDERPPLFSEAVPPDENTVCLWFLRSYVILGFFSFLCGGTF